MPFTPRAALTAALFVALLPISAPVQQPPLPSKATVVVLPGRSLTIAGWMLERDD
jgi:hypothetical protein